MMKHATQDNGNYGDDDSLEGIEGEEGFGLPGQSVVASYRFADIGNSDENTTDLGAKTVDTIDVTGEPQVANNEGLSSVSPGSLGTLINGVNEGKKMSLNARIAYVIENGEPFCNHCEKNFVPSSFGTRIACTYCGCNRPNDDHGLNDINFAHTASDNLEHVEGPTVGDIDGKNDIIKEESKKDFADEALEAFKRASTSDSDLYQMGRMDSEGGKPLDEDLALLSKDYWQGYQDQKFYNKTPQQSAGQLLYDMKPNSNATPKDNYGQMTPGDADRGPLELTDGTNRATAGKETFYNLTDFSTELKSAFVIEANEEGIEDCQLETADGTLPGFKGPGAKARCYTYRPGNEEEKQAARKKAKDSASSHKSRVNKGKTMDKISTAYFQGAPSTLVGNTNEESMRAPSARGTVPAGVDNKAQTGIGEATAPSGIQPGELNGANPLNSGTTSSKRFAELVKDELGKSFCTKHNSFDECNQDSNPL